MRHPRKLLAGAILAFTLPALAACSQSSDSKTSSSAGGEQSSGTLRVVSTFANATFPDPATDYIEPTFGDAEYLLRPTSDGPKPWLASSYKQVDDLTWTVTLRPDLKFQNGHALDAKALVAYFEYQMANNPLAKTTMGNPTGFTALDDRTVQIKLATPYPSMPYAFASYSLDIYDAATVESVHGKYEQLAGQGVFTGPYEYEKSSGNTVTYTANPHYYLGKPAYKKLSLNVVASADAGEAAMAAGEADIQTQATTEEKRQIASNSNLVFKTSASATNYSAFCLDPQKAPFGDVKVRQAFALAIDNDAISKTVTNGVRPALTGVFQKDSSMNVAWKSYNVAKANSLLDEAGWAKGTGGVRTKDGKTLSVQIATYDSDQQAIATAASAMLQKVGFAVKVVPEENWDAIPPLINGDGPVNSEMQNLQNLGYEGDAYLAVAKSYDPTNQYNLSVRDSQIWSLFQKLLASSDKTESASLFKQILTLDGQKAYYVPVVANPTTLVVTDKFKNLQVDPFGVLITYDTKAEGH